MKELVFEDMEAVNESDGIWHWSYHGEFLGRPSAREIAMLDEIVGLRQRVEELERGSAAINQALNEGDGTYKP